MTSFKETGLKPEILEALHDLGFKKPTPIQEKSIPQLLDSDKDLMALAQTGTGKTAAFGLPIIQKIDPKDKNTQALIIAPTRELALQITDDLKNFSKYIKGINIVTVYGGSSIENQIRDLRKGAQIVVATPGRAKDLINRGKLRLDQVKFVVLDEADEMLTMGFKDDLDAILSATPEDKQVLLFSATMSKEIERIAKNYMKNAAKISVAEINKGVDTVEHIYHIVNAKDRYEVLKRIADINPDIYAIVFTRTRREAKDVAAKLMQDGYNADAIHGDLSQAQRDEVMKRFRNKQLQLLVATDVAARGIDVNNLTHVINYNLPDQSEYYTHRSGRTGRAGNKGTSIAIIHSREKGKLKEIEKKSGIKFRYQLVPNGEEICSRQVLSLSDKIVNTQVDETQIEPFLNAIYKKFENLDREELIKRFVSAEFNRFLDYYKNARDINIVDDIKDRGRNKKGSSNLIRMFLNVGKKENLTPLKLIGIINNTLDNGNAEIGKIEVLRNFSFFEIEPKAAQQLLTKIKSQKFEGRELSVEIANPKEGGSEGKRNKSSKKRERKDRNRRKGGRRRF